MITARENTTRVSVSELRSGTILTKTKQGLVVIEKRHKPIAVLMTIAACRHLHQVQETAEDIVLGSLAREREQKSNTKDFVALESLLS